jgi:SAM-dependent methyltransferase
MEPDQYTYMFEAEDHLWWYIGNHEIFLNLLQRNNILKKGINMLDAGCGTGGWLQFLKRSCDINETGIDNREIALNYARSRGKLNLVCGDINNYIFNESSFDLITSFDVIYHHDVDDDTAIKSFHRCLKNGGHILLTVPAYSFLFSKHDEVVHTKKRYTKKQIKLLLRNNGFEIIKISYGVSLLFPIALIKRFFDKIFRSGNEEHNELKMPPVIINRFFLWVMRTENFLLKYVSLPLGLSVMVLAKKAEMQRP